MKNIYIYLQPKSAKTEYLGDVNVDASRYGISGDKTIQAMKIKLNSPPVDGAANKALIKFLAKHLTVSPSRLTIVKGEKSRYKLVVLDSSTL
ncbi:MAG: DUF167 domain-containing protein [Candidatus Melainabacteria bacterium]|jgi:uncharacterized protein|nr:DUF167 domain-containing protein [Candidatus Melainabacteria bacterium]